jgi:hypothetical protein
VTDTIIYPSRFSNDQVPSQSPRPSSEHALWQPLDALLHAPLKHSRTEMREPSVHPHENGEHSSFDLHDPEGVGDDGGEDALSPPPAVPVQPPWLKPLHALGQ